MRTATSVRLVTTVRPSAGDIDTLVASEMANPSPQVLGRRRRLGAGSTVMSMARVEWVKSMTSWTGAREVTPSNMGCPCQ